MKKIILFGIGAMLIISSCTIEKRVYMRGYNIEWNNHLGKFKKDKVQDEDLSYSDVEIAPETTKNSSKKEVLVLNGEVIIGDETTSIEMPTNGMSLEEVASTNVPAQQNNAAEQKAKLPAITKSIIDHKASESSTITSKRKIIQSAKSLKEFSKDEVPTILLYVLCFFIPFLAVGLATDWDVTAVVINLLLCFLFFLPGVIHAIIVVGKNS